MLPKTVDILAINETRLDSSIQNGEVSIPGYTLERKDRNRNGGGVALYIRDSINYKRLIDLPDETDQYPRVETESKSIYCVHLV